MIKRNQYICTPQGELAHLARALRWQRRGNEFDSRILHKKGFNIETFFYFIPSPISYNYHIRFVKLPQFVCTNFHHSSLYENRLYLLNISLIQDEFVHPTFVPVNRHIIKTYISFLN